MAGDNRIGIGT